MDETYLAPLSEALTKLVPFFSIGMGLLLIWSFYWKGRALWRAARLNDKAWFIILLLVNTLGVVEIIYLYTTQNRNRELQTPDSPRTSFGSTG
ncbi:MAG: hypothetical protein COT34_00260 [Candidatus Nealsonbacteria bacterium CG08_land_8_20_14_0_20_43_11]|uniref:DUF5652 domain-containing protein n=1 Tax=Candidatus Nealsonbacteria bacterium CG08_land_8_20_14_0_20_43_11 TaxID=1974706 RepID=A0A2M6T1B7_9BACT|nr:MAG: hypothetical protein COT34_00260 [Candidatus Nealsonbacteria bacterium CG08_land_8_20_14_0_20_43_11]